jgi:lysophospholipase L1-like esterase
MKRYLILSVLLNVILVCLGLFAARKIADREARDPVGIDPYMQSRKEAYALMPVDGDDVVFVGNSITERFLVSELFGPNYKNRGISGNRSRHILERIESIANDKPRKIFLMIGVNDIKDHSSLDTLLSNTNKIVTIIRSKSPHSAIFIQSVFPTAKDFDYLNATISRYNGLLRQYCAEKKIRYIDLHKWFVSKFDTMTYDGLHLNGKGYDLWKKIIMPYL